MTSFGKRDKKKKGLLSILKFQMAFINIDFMHKVEELFQEDCDVLVFQKRQKNKSREIFFQQI